MLLHGTYDNGKIILKGKKFPKIKADIEIIIKDNVIDLSKLKAFGIWKDRTDINDSSEFVKQTRKKISGRHQLNAR